MIKNIYFTYCPIPIIIAKNEIVQHEVYIVANIVPDVRPGCLYRSAKAATIGSSLTQGFAVLRAAGVNLHSLAIIESAEPDNIVFREEA